MSVNFVSIHDIDYENNLSNIEETILVDISIKPKIVDNVHIGAFFSPNEIKTFKSLF